MHTDLQQVADSHFPARTTRRERIEASAFACFAVLHAPGVAAALSQPALTSPQALTALAAVVVSQLLWVCLAVWAALAAQRGRLVPRALVAVALALDAVVLTVSGLVPPRLGNITAASVGLIAVCAAAALLTRPRLLSVVVVPAVAGQALLLWTADASTTTVRLVADTATVAAASAATAALIAWLEHDRRAVHVALARAASTDPLTGLLNRRGLSQEWSTGAGSSGSSGPRGGPVPAHVVVIDIDHFKSVNDRRGHDVGDEVLVTVAQALRECSREADLLVRLGGEELAWVAAWRTPVAAAAAAESLRVLVSTRTRESGEAVTISAGVAALSHEGTGTGPLGAEQALADALVRADRALYRAKAAGRDRVEVALD